MNLDQLGTARGKQDEKLKAELEQLKTEFWNQSVLKTLSDKRSEILESKAS